MVFIKGAEIHWSAERCMLEYSCVFCELTFNTHLDCLQHLVEPCELSPVQVVPQTEQFDNPTFVELIAAHGYLPGFQFTNKHQRPTNPKPSNASNDHSNELEIGLVTCDNILADDSQKYENPSQHNEGQQHQQNVVIDGGNHIDESYGRTRDSSIALLCTCDICGAQCADSQQMLQHMQNVHRSASGSDHQLNQSPIPRKHAVNGDVERNRKFKDHKPFCCQICGIRMSERGNLRKHMRIHTGERPFACQFDGCTYRFMHSSERTIHHRKHTGERPFQCDACARQFYTHTHLAVHQRKAHTDERPFGCAVCDKRFKDRKTCVNHERTHTEERPYGCEVCGKAFRQQGAYRVHMNIHTDQRPFKCGQCERGFHSTAARWSHEKNFHKVL